MSEPFVGEIRMFAGNFVPRGWAFCDGQLLSVAQNDALFNLFGTIYGGDGRTTFGLPDLRGRIPLHSGSGPGLTPRALGSKSGTETVTLTDQQLAGHTHAMQVSSASATGTNPENDFLGASPSVRLFRPSTPNQPMASAAVAATDGNQAHTNLMPFVCIHYIVALVGIFPERN